MCHLERDRETEQNTFQDTLKGFSDNFRFSFKVTISMAT